MKEQTNRTITLNGEELNKLLINYFNFSKSAVILISLPDGVAVPLPSDAKFEISQLNIKEGESFIQPQKREAAG